MMTLPHEMLWWNSQRFLSLSYLFDMLGSVTVKHFVTGKYTRYWRTKFTTK